MADSSTKGFTARDKSAEGSHCVSMTTRNGFKSLTPTCESTTIQRERVVTFPWQQWLRERETILDCAYIACFLSVRIPHFFVQCGLCHGAVLSVYVAWYCFKTPFSLRKFLWFLMPKFHLFLKKKES